MGVSSYKCKSAFRDFGKSVADANAESVAKRTKLVTAAQAYLKQQMDKAQAEGDLDKVLVFKTALESARNGEFAGDDEAIVKLRESYAKQLVLADRALFEAGLAAARACAGTLEWQKKDATKKGDFDDAQKTATFQKKLEGWSKSIQAQAAQTASAQSMVQTTASKPQPRPQSRESLSTIKQLEPEAKTYTINAKSRNGTSIGEVNAGDTIVIQYVDGKWETYPDEPVESPDQNEIRHGGCRLRLSKFAERNYVVAVIPAGTQHHPFRYLVDESTSGVLALRIGGEHVSDNVGSVRYMVRVIPANNAER